MKKDKRKIILVDDVMFQLISLKERLKDKYTVYTANTFDVLLQHLSKIKPNPDLIIMDINMPGKDGFEIAEVLKTFPNFADIPVIFLTGKSDPESLTKATQLGAADFLVKPVSDADLIESIEKQLNPADNSM